MSGAVPLISPATGRAIYEATAKAEKAHAEAEQLADVEYRELTRLTGTAKQAELAMYVTIVVVAIDAEIGKQQSDQD